LFEELANPARAIATATLGRSMHPGVQLAALDLLSKLLPDQPTPAAAAAVVAATPHFLTHARPAALLKLLSMAQGVWQQLARDVPKLDITAPDTLLSGAVAGCVPGTAGAVVGGTLAATIGGSGGAAYVPQLRTLLLALLGASDVAVRAAALRFWHGVLPKGLARRLQVCG